MSKRLFHFVSSVLILTLIGSGYGNVLFYCAQGHVTAKAAKHSHCHHSQLGGHSSDSEYEHHTQDEQANTRISTQCRPCVNVGILKDAEFVKIQLPHLCKLAHLDSVAVDSTTLNRGLDFQRTSHFSFFKPLETIILLT